MTDHFALLNEPRRPWLEPESLKEKFLALSSAMHPDRVHHLSDAERRAAQERYTELNAAYNCLREPKERLRHLLELEFGTKPGDVQRIPPDLMDFSLEVSRLCREVDGFLAEKSGITSPLLKVQLFERSQEWTDKLTGMQKRVQAWREEVFAEVKAIDGRWGDKAESRSGVRGPFSDWRRFTDCSATWRAGRCRFRNGWCSFLFD